MGVILERERKLEVPEGFVLPAVGAAARLVTLVSIYHDTPDRRLAAAGITLRHRTQAGRAAWQAKLPAETGRVEIELPGSDAVPDEITDLLSAHLRGADPAAVATLRTRRRRRRVSRGGREVAEISHDEVVVDGGVGARLDEVEIELLDAGTERDLDRLTRRLEKAGATVGDQRAKVFRVLGVAPTGRAAPRTAQARLGAVLSTQVTAMLQHDPHVRLGADPEALHQYRVATRRLRALLRAARPSLDRGWADGLRGELGALADETGDARDLDVFSARLAKAAKGMGRDRAATAQLIERLAPARAAARDRVLQALRGPGYVPLLDRLVTECAEPPVARRVRPVAAAAAEFRRLRRAAAAIGSADEEELHRLRIAGKRARYAAELATGPDDRAAAAFLKAAKTLQDVLGEHQDTVVAEARLRELAAEAPTPVALAAGRLVERECRSRADARAELPQAWRGVLRAARRWDALA